MELSNVPQVIPSEIHTHDNTMMSAFAYCERLYALTHVLNRKPTGSKPALSFGGLVHTGLDAYYRHLKNSDDNGQPRDAAEAAAYAFIFMDLQVNGGINPETEEEVIPSFEDPLDDYRTSERAKLLLLNYVKHYQEDPDINRIVFTETPHDVSFPDGFKWGGIVDLWCESLGGTWIVDHKTTSQFGQFYFDDYKRSPQMLGYMLTGAALKGVWPSGVIVNVLVNRKTGMEFARKYMTYEEWLVEECKQMQVVNYTFINAKRQMMELAVSTEEMTAPQAAMNPYLWKPNFYNCVGKYGRCSMYDVCHSRPENRERVIEMETEEREWDWRTVRD